MPPHALTRTRARRRALLIALLSYSAGRAVAAAESDAPIASASLELAADAGCATRADLIARVRARSPRVRFVVDGSGLLIRVQISMLPSGAVSSEVTLANPGTKAVTRHVPAHSCNEAVDAAALIIAVTLDPTSADHAATPSATTADAPRSDQGDSAKGATSSTGAPSTAASKPPAARSNAEASAGSEREGGSTPRARTTFAAQLAAEGIVGVAPGVMPAVALFATVGVERGSRWSPTFVLGVRHAWRSDFQAPGGSASFVLDAATLDACPVRFRTGAFEARPCAFVLFGRFVAEGTDTLNPQAESVRPFWTLGGAGVVTVDLTRLLQITGRLALGANLVRDSFEFNPSTFHEVPKVSAAASVGVGAHFR